METGKHFVSYIAVAVFFLAYEYSNARPMMDSIYGDYVYSGAIHPISGAVPKKIHSYEEKSSSDTYAAGNARPMMNSLYGDYIYSGAIHPISGAVPKKIHNHKQGSSTDTSAPESNSDTSAAESNTDSSAAEAKKIFDMLNIDLNHIDLSQSDGAHKFDGKDSLQPSLCHDTYNDRYGVGKHFVRGARDVGFAIVSGAENLLDGLLGDLPLVPNITSGIGGGLKAIICAIEDGFSDIGGDIDSVIGIAKNGLVDLFKLKGPRPVLDIPVGIGDIATDAVKAGGQLVGDAVGGVKNAVGEILDAL